MTSLARAVLLLAACLTAACGQGDSTHDGGSAREAQVREGPHGGRLLGAGDFALEVTIYERGVPPGFRLYAFVDDEPVPPEDVTASITLRRLGGRTERIGFTPERDYLRADAIVEEPHSFDVQVEAAFAGETHRWAYSQVEDRVSLPDDALASAGIEVATAGPTTIRTSLELPGQVGLDQDRVAHVVPRLAGVVSEVHVKLGAQVQATEVLAAIDSRDLAEAKNEYLESIHALEFAQATYVREERLWKRRISPESDYLLSRHKLEEAEIAKQIAEQKLLALGIGRDVLAALAVEPQGSVVERKVRAPFPAQALTRYELRSPIAGEVIEKHLALGEFVQADSDAFVVADLSSVWVDVAVYATDLGLVRIGQRATIRSQATGREASGTVSYVGPVIGEESRSARARIELPNPDGVWRPGLFVSVQLVEAEVTVPVAVRADAVQTLRDAPVVFVRYGDEFEARPVELGRRGDGQVEVTKGLAPGERYASTNSFVLKADVGKTGASHDH